MDDTILILNEEEDKIANSVFFYKLSQKHGEEPENRRKLGSEDFCDL